MCLRHFPTVCADHEDSERLPTRLVQHMRVRRLRPEPALAPVEERQQDGAERPSLRGEMVLVPWRPLAIQTAIEEAVCDQPLETCAENRAGYPQDAMEMLELRYSREGQPEHEKAPPVADDRQRAADRRL